MSGPWILLFVTVFLGVSTVGRVGQPEGCWLPWEYEIWGRVHPVVVRGAEMGSHFGILAPWMIEAPPGCVFMMVVLD